MFNTKTFQFSENSDIFFWLLPKAEKDAVEGVSVSEEEREGYAWLEERESPEGIAVVGAKYKGPMFVDK